MLEAARMLEKKVTAVCEWVTYDNEDVGLEVTVGGLPLCVDIVLSLGEDGVWYYIHDNKPSMSYVKRNDSELNTWLSLVVNMKLCDLRADELVKG